MEGVRGGQIRNMSGEFSMRILEGQDLRSLKRLEYF